LGRKKIKADARTDLNTVPQLSPEPIPPKNDTERNRPQLHRFLFLPSQTKQTIKSRNMKKLILSVFMALAGTATVFADGYSYLTFVLTDGNKISVNVSSLKLTISGTTLTNGSDYFSLANLSSMHFSTSDESTTTGISAITPASIDDATQIYDLQGKKITPEQMSKGVYIIRTDNVNRIILVK